MKFSRKWIGFFILLLAALACSTANGIPTQIAQDPPVKAQEPVEPWNVVSFDVTDEQPPYDATTMAVTKLSTEATELTHGDYVIHAYDTNDTAGAVIAVYHITKLDLALIKINPQLRTDGAVVLDKAGAFIAWPNVGVAEKNVGQNLVVDIKDCPFLIYMSYPADNGAKQVWLVDR